MWRYKFGLSQFQDQEAKAETMKIGTRSAVFSRELHSTSAAESCQSMFTA